MTAVTHDADTTARTGRLVWYLLLAHWSRQRALSTTELSDKLGLTVRGMQSALQTLYQCPTLPLVRITSSSGYRWTMNYRPLTFESVLRQCGSDSLPAPWSAALVAQRWVSRGLFNGTRVTTAREVSGLLGKSVILSGRLVTKLCGPGGLPGWDEWRGKWYIDLSWFDQIKYPDRGTIVGG